MPPPPDNPIDRALRAVPPDRRFVVAYANPDRPQVVLTLHSKDGSPDALATRTITLEDEGLVIFDLRNSFKDIVAPSGPEAIGEQVRALVYAFANECEIADKDLYFGGGRPGSTTTTPMLQLPDAWTDRERIGRAQAGFKEVDQKKTRVSP